jgi:hypothetical protein
VLAAYPDPDRFMTDAPWSTRASLELLSFMGPVAIFAFACWSAAAMVGRFGARVTAERVSVAGLVAAFGAAALSLFQIGWVVALTALILLFPVGGGSAWLGARWGIRLRNRSFLRPPPPPAGHH